MRGSSAGGRRRGGARRGGAPRGPGGGLGGGPRPRRRTGRRAVNLHRAACAVVERHGGSLPDDLAALLALPGVGPYTARAVLVFAFERDIGLVDTNAGRFVARAGAGRALAAREAQVVADGLVPEGMGWAWGSAVFDLGALVCRRRAPACSSCPVVGSCAWARAGWAEPDPVTGSAGISGGQAPF